MNLRPSKFHLLSLLLHLALKPLLYEMQTPNVVIKIFHSLTLTFPSYLTSYHSHPPLACLEPTTGRLQPHTLLI